MSQRRKSRAASLNISAQGIVVAAVSPTMFAATPGTVHYLVQAGDVVKKDEPIATLESPELRNELAREESSLARPRIAMQRQRIDTHRERISRPPISRT